MTEAPLRLPTDDPLPISAVFVDAENMAVDRERGIIDFDVDRVMVKINELSRPIVRRAYADWFKLRNLRAAFLRSGFDQVQTTYINRSKNSLDMQLCVDAMETVLLSPSIKVVFLVTADSDFSALARGMRRHNRMVIAIGWREKTNQIFRNNCDQFLHYEDLPAAEQEAEAPDRPTAARAPESRPPAAVRPAPAGPVEPRRSRAEPPPDRKAAEPPPPPSRAAQARRNLADLNPAIARLVLENGPGAAIGVRAMNAAFRAGGADLTPGAFGMRNFPQLVEAHPLLTRDWRTSGVNASVLLPRRIDLRAILPAQPLSVEAAQTRLAETTIGFLGRERQYRVLRHLHRAYLSGQHEPFTRQEQVETVAGMLDDVTVEDVEKVDRLIWRAKLFQVVDRSTREPMSWKVRLKDDYAEFDTFQFQHDKQLVAEGMLAGVVLNARGWALLLDGDDQDTADFADILLDLGFDDPDFASDDDEDEDGDDGGEGEGQAADGEGGDAGRLTAASRPPKVDASPSHYLVDDRDDVDFDLGEDSTNYDRRQRPAMSAAPAPVKPVVAAHGHIPERPHHVETSPRLRRPYDL